ncbi:MAG: 50S ribosomal protein L11 methyltransferase [Bacteroidia bacterium]|nr:50S ribosomal protein L11 methyltransferase [Bacteroidia bacterium]
MDYIGVSFIAAPESTDVLVAFLSGLGYEGFEENGQGIAAYIPAESFDEIRLTDTLSSIPGLADVSFTSAMIPDQNWNLEWEKNFSPVWVGDRIFVRAPFHPEISQAEIEIVIEPKMSFGTGHHATTSLMCIHLSELNVSGKSVLDMGCGSGILGILAMKLGAREVVGVDHDERAVLNCRENQEINSITPFQVIKGDATFCMGKSFDIILANINRNILLQDIPSYASALVQGGSLLVSGFLSEDEKLIEDAASRFHLIPVKTGTRENWMCVTYSNRQPD